MTKSGLIGSIIVILFGLGAIAGTFLLASNNPVKQEGVLNDATDILSGGAAASAGRQARDPLINTEQGNMLVFFFTIGSLTASSIIGYNWRSLMRSKNRRKEAMPARPLIALSAAVFMFWIMLAAREGFSGDPIFDPVMGDLVLFIFAAIGAFIGCFAGYQFQGYLMGRKVRAEVHSIG